MVLAEGPLAPTDYETNGAYYVTLLMKISWIRSRRCAAKKQRSRLFWGGRQVWQMLASVLHMSNLEFDKVDHEQGEIASVSDREVRSMCIRSNVRSARHK